MEESRAKGYSYWHTHPYVRRSVKNRDFIRFCGWDKLQTTINNIDLLNGALVCALFETGGRATEVLTLTPNHIDLYDDHVMFNGMLVKKRREKIEGEWVKTTAHRDFPIPLRDPLIQPLLDYINDMNPNERIFKYGYHWLYKKIRDIEKPKDAKHGPWWPHRFRAERATQLVIEEGFNVHYLMEWFGWVREITPTGYVRLGAEELKKKMGLVV